MLISVGSGFWRKSDISSIYRLRRVMPSVDDIIPEFVNDTIAQSTIVMQAISESGTPWQLNSEIATTEDRLLVDQPLCRYQKYDLPLEVKTIDGLVGSDVGSKGQTSVIGDLRKMRSLSFPSEKVLDSLSLIGRRHAERSVLASHFPMEFDLRFEPI